MHQPALTSAVGGLFVLAGVAWAAGCSALTCAGRALVGAVVIYFVVRTALRLAASIIADAAVRKLTERRNATRNRP